MARSNARISCDPAGGWSDLMIESSISAQPLAVALAAAREVTQNCKELDCQT